MSQEKFLLIKPVGIGSMKFLDDVRRVLKIKKIGHVGALDPNASGLMIVLTGDSVKESGAIRDLKKEYIGLIKFHKHVDVQKVEVLIKSLSGKTVTQTPPKRSAVVSKPRMRKIHFLEILSFDGRNLKFRIICESGFYVRSFASDLGEELNVGAHLQELERTKIGKYELEAALTMEELRMIYKSKK